MRCIVKTLKPTAILLSFILLLGCSHSIDKDKYKGVSPKFDLYGFFEGDVKAWGIVQNRSGNVVQRFIVDINGTIKNDILTLDEKFEYGMGDGVKKRVWTIKKLSETTYSGEASDMLNTATGEVSGNALRWQYKMELPVGDKSYKVSFDDWMWSFNENTLMNRSYIKKFGLVMAEVTIFMQKQ